MLKIWNLLLVIITFGLSIFGTFLTRSGVVSSVHAFTQSGWIGPIFIVFLGVAMAVSVGLLLYRLPQLRTEHRLDSLLSRESAFLFNNLLLVGSAFSVLWGTMFPVISELVTGTQITVGPPFFNKVNIPIALALILLTGVGPLIAWRRTTPGYLLRNFIYPGIGTLITATTLFALGVTSPLPLAAFAFCSFVIFTIVLEFYRGTMARRRNVGSGYVASFLGLIDKNKRRYGGYVVHLGMMVLFIGVAASSAFQTETTASVAQGDSFELGAYRMQFMNTVSERTPNLEQITTRVKVWKGDEHVDTLYPQRRFYQHPEQATTEVDRYTPMRGDLYLIFIDYNPQDGKAVFKAFHNPLVKFVWLGWMVVILGTLLAILPEGRWLTAGFRVRNPAPEAATRA